MGLRYVRAEISGGFWGKYRDLVRREVLPYQWKALNDEIPGAPPSHAVENFRIAGGKGAGEYVGMVFQDSDLAKWLEAAAHMSADGGAANSAGNENIRAWAKTAIAFIADAQRPDGYLNTYFTVKEPGRRWKNLREAHELYCAGHLIEAGVAAYRGLGDEKMLRVVRALADHIDSRFGVGEGKIRGYCGHEEIELSLVKLYRLTGEKRYLELAEYFIDERGKAPNYFELEAASPDFKPIWGLRDLDYMQARVPVRELRDADGHAVRSMYLCTAMADIALETGDKSLVETCGRLWRSAAGARMYVTGSIGSTEHGEAFTFDYDLPNDSAYAETCAAIGMFFFANRMAALHDDSRYADVMELALYNGILSGLSLDGKSYFYVNPLEVVPEACDGNPALRHVKYRRQPWYGCACCPPNIARLIASLGEYAYRIGDDALYADHFHEGTVSCEVGGKPVSLRQRGDYPISENVSFEFTGSEPVDFDLAVRIPAWCRCPDIVIAGRSVDVSSVLVKGYAHVRRRWKPGDRLDLRLPMTAERLRADPRVRADFGKTAIKRGPFVYCLEEADNGPNLHTAALSRDSELRTEFRSDLFGGTHVIAARGSLWEHGNDAGSLYRGGETASSERELVFIPYYAWANRAPGEMRVWVRE